MTTIVIEGIPDDGRAERVAESLRAMLPSDLVVTTVTEDCDNNAGRLAA